MKPVARKFKLSALITSGRSENRKTLQGIIRGLPINVCTTSTIEQALELLSDNSVDIIFCDEQLSDGPYQDLLGALSAEHKMTRFAVLLASDESQEYVRAIQLGASDVIPRCYQSTDIELVLMRLGREARTRDND